MLPLRGERAWSNNSAAAAPLLRLPAAPCSSAPTPTPTPAHPRPALAETTRETIELTFQRFVARGDVGLIIVNQPVANTIRPTITAHT